MDDKVEIGFSMENEDFRKRKRSGHLISGGKVLQSRFSGISRDTGDHQISVREFFWIHSNDQP